MAKNVFVPAVGRHVKLRKFDDYGIIFADKVSHEGGVPVWAWLRVERVDAAREVVHLRLLNGDKEAEPHTRCVSLGMIQPPIGWKEEGPQMYIPPDRVAEVRRWFKERGGAKLWIDCNIPPSASEIMTPALAEDGSPKTPPGWRYADGYPLKPEEIAVRTEQILEAPASWFPVCEECGGKKHFTFAEYIASEQARMANTNLGSGYREWVDALTPETLLASLRAKDNVKEGEDYTESTIRCYRCSGRGHQKTQVTVGIRRHYWGMDITPSAKDKAAKLAKKLGNDVKWTWEYQGYGRAALVFYRETVTPFTVE
jgi:hypothetical protein